jgi:arabinogalactan oligomer/maltooligosaccharide transport system permease protein
MNENVKQKRHMGMKLKTTISNIIVYAILIVVSIVWLVPFVFILLESFRVESAMRVDYIIPQQWGFDNYINLFKEHDFLKWFINTTLCGLAVAVIQTLFVLSTSYTLSRLRFKGRRLLMNAMLVLGMFPGFLSMILLYKVLSWFNLTGTNAIPGLIIVYCASSGMGYYISKGFFDTIPKSLDEAARVDGANRFQVFYKVIMPLAKPIVIYTILTAFMAPWGDFMFAKYIAHASSKGMNVAVGLQYMISSPTSISANYTKFCAGGVIVAIPITLLFLFLQKYYVEGVTGGAVKG